MPHTPAQNDRNFFKCSQCKSTNDTSQLGSAVTSSKVALLVVLVGNRGLEREECFKRFWRQWRQRNKTAGLPLSRCQNCSRWSCSVALCLCSFIHFDFRSCPSRPTIPTFACWTTFRCFVPASLAQFQLQLHAAMGRQVALVALARRSWKQGFSQRKLILESTVAVARRFWQHGLLHCGGIWVACIRMQCHTWSCLTLVSTSHNTLPF